MLSPYLAHPIEALNRQERAFLDAFGFDEATFRGLVAVLHQRGYDAASNWVRSPLAPPPPGTIDALPPEGSRGREALAETGARAVADGRVGVVLLNGGMATRFGGVVKGIVEALPGESFLRLAARRLLAVEDETGGRIPFVLMNSFATDEATRHHLDETGWLGLRRDRVRTFVQGIFPRLRPDGSLFRDPSGQASYYGPGHGDVCACLGPSGALAWLRDRGVELVMTYNVDNLGAGPVLEHIGHHLRSGRELTVEVVEKVEGDSGGCPAWLDGRVQVLEGFRIPPSFDQDAVPVFNTNTLLIDRSAIEQAWPLTWFQVLKRVDGGEVVQFERLVGQLTAWLSTSYLEVPRFGPAGRFLPVKTPAELRALQPVYRKMFPRRLKDAG